MHKLKNSRLTNVLLICLLSIYSLLAGSQEHDKKIDSLRALIQSENVDTIKYTLYSSLVNELEKIDRSAAIQPLKEKLSLAYKIKDEKRIARTSQELGSEYLYLGNSDSSLVYTLRANSLHKKLNVLSRLTDGLNNLALIYQRNNQYEEAVESYHQVIVYADSLNDPVGEIYALVNLMSLFMDLEDHSRALEYFDQIEKTINQIPLKNKRAWEELNDAYSVIYLNAGQCYDKLNKLDSAMILFERATKNLSKISYDYGKKYYKGYIDDSMGEVLYKLSKANKNPDSSHVQMRQALTFYTEANKSFREVEDSRGKAFTLNNIGKTLNELGQFTTARTKLMEALEIAEDIKFREEIRDSYEHLAKNAEMTNNFSLANSYLKTWIIYRDSIRNDERVKFTRGQEVRFETAKKEKEISELEFQNELSAQRQTIRNYIYFTSILLLLGIAYMLFTRFRYKKQKEKVEFEREVNTAMARFVPMAFINAIGREKITDVKLGDQIEKVVTVVFTDIRGFTTISEGMTPEDNFAFVKDYAERMGPIIQRNNGFISQYLGDGIMAIFQNNSEDALKACLQMQEDIEEYNESLVGKGREKIKVGMGMHTGSLIMGIIGDEVRRDATLISDTVNTAARIESTTKELQVDILLSESSVRQLSNPKNFYLIPMGEINVKGKLIPLQVYQCQQKHKEDNVSEPDHSLINN